MTVATGLECLRCGTGYPPEDLVTGCPRCREQGYAVNLRPTYSQEAFRAVREARGFQPEAHTGLGIIYEEEGKYEEAATAFRKAVAQLSDTEPVLYELLARNLEKLERWKEAVAAYEKYLELAPQGAHASAINSIIDQLRRQAEEAEQQRPPR